MFDIGGGDEGRRRVALRLVVAVATLGAVVSVSAPAMASTPPCGDVHTFFARGSGLGYDDTATTVPWFEAMRAAVGGEGVAYQELEIGDVETGSETAEYGYFGDPYPASGAPSDLVGGFFQSYFGFGVDYGDYRDSVNTGVAELTDILTRRAQDCPNEAFVVGGFSQGAQVVGEASFDLPASVTDQIVSYTLFGDPKLLAQFTFFDNPFSADCQGEKPVWRRGTAACGISGGILLARDPYVPSSGEPVTGSWCADLDAICTGFVNDLPDTVPGLSSRTGPHFSYFDDGGAVAEAAYESAVALAARRPEIADSLDLTRVRFGGGVTGSDLVFVFDTTGSMGGLIDDAKRDALDLANQWLGSQPNARVGLVQYRDQGDVPVARVEIGLTDSAEDFQTAVNGLYASGGGDYPEAMLTGMSVGLEQMEWLQGATKAMVVIADAPGRDPDPVLGGTTRSEIAQRALEIDPVNLYAVAPPGSNGDDVEAFFQPMADTTNGDVVRFSSELTFSDALYQTITDIAALPIADAQGPYVGATGTTLTFDSSRSFSFEGDIVSHEWDFDNDGVYDSTSDSPTTTHTYSDAYEGIAVLRVTDSTGASAIATAQVFVTPEGVLDQLPDAPTDAQYVLKADGTATVSWTPPASADTIIVFDETGELLASVDGATSSVTVPAPAGTVLVVAGNAFGNSEAVEAVDRTPTTSTMLSPTADLSIEHIIGTGSGGCGDDGGSTSSMSVQTTVESESCSGGSGPPPGTPNPNGGSSTLQIGGTAYGDPAAGYATRWTTLIDFAFPSLPAYGRIDQALLTVEARKNGDPILTRVSPISDSWDETSTALPSIRKSTFDEMSIAPAVDTTIDVTAAVADLYGNGGHGLALYFAPGSDYGMVEIYAREKPAFQATLQLTYTTPEP